MRTNASITALMSGSFIYQMNTHNKDTDKQPSQSFIVSFDVPVNKGDQIELPIELTEKEVEDSVAPFGAYSVFRVKHSFVTANYPTIDVLCQRKIPDCKMPSRIVEIDVPTVEGEK